jgi:hypothetical protein
MLGNFHVAFWLVPLILFPFIKIFLARPVKAQYQKPQCLRCKRLNVMFRSPFHKICDDCLTEREQAKGRR